MTGRTADARESAADSLRLAIAQLPPPLNTDSYTIRQRGIFERDDIEVVVNDRVDFAFLHPRPSMDYRQYKPRSERLNLKPSRIGRGMQERLDKISSCFASAGSLLEIGAAEGSFLKEVRGRFPSVALACIEPDEKTAPQRRQLAGLTEFSDASAARSSGARFDVVGAFHVFEHIEQPRAFLDTCAALLTRDGSLILEVPAVTDPLLSLYHVPAYEAFYFQQQHPFVYSGASLSRLLDHAGFRVKAVIPFQRYGLANHLTWLTRGEPGGDETYATVFEAANDPYRAALERCGATDTVIAIASPRG